MRDHLFNEALRRLATDAASRFSILVAGGDQVPFDVAERDGEEAAFFSYVPLTGRYVEERAAELQALPSFPAARDAVVETGVAAAYLEARGETVAADPVERAERMLTVFVSSLWEGCAEFSLDRAKLEGALAVLGAEARGADEADVLIAPVVGLRMPMARLELPHGVRVVRADAVEAPTEAMRSEGMGRAAWEPQFLAVAEQEGAGGAEAAMQQLRELISVMRIFKEGGIGLGPHAFAPTGEGQWRRLATGAPATRPGGYKLNEGEATELVELARRLEAQPDPDGALTWAVGRFEMGCERASAMEGLSDHLLALRAVLEGHGPVGASLPMRAAALIADDSYDRIEARERVEQVLELERELMNGRAGARALDLASWTEHSARRLLRDAALGELGADLSSAADESLIASGLETGTAEISLAASDVPDPVAPSFANELSPVEEPIDSALPAELPDSSSLSAELSEEEEMEQETRILEPIPAEDEIKITATHWLDEVSETEDEIGGVSLEWPALDSEIRAVEGDVQHRERIDTPRVRHLFPVPDSDWEVNELDYSRRAG
ncbi:MAG TPA: hypothetical protein VK889_02665 [Solirubrobacterales bacterium]|nr:hypothetical protein [Solirubrobacterales bacterium]